MTDRDRLADRARGCLIGLACGDALGGPVEFIDRAEIAARYPDGLRDFVGGGWLNLSPGEITDDTQMTLAVARSLTQDGLDLDLLSAEFLAWYRSNPKDIGNTTRAALALLNAGIAPDEAGERVRLEMGDRGAGNGSVMRCAPLAIRFRNDPVRLVAASLASARITHADRRCAWGAVAINQAIAHLLNGGGTDSVLEAAIARVEDPDVCATVLAAPDRPRDAVKSGGFVLDTVGSALWCLFNSDGFEEAVVAAVGLGADADTTAAVTGALAGAAYGQSAIPERWRTTVQHRDQIDALAIRLYLFSNER